MGRWTKGADWRRGLPSRETIAAHATAHPDCDGGWWLCRRPARTPKGRPGEVMCTVLIPGRAHDASQLEWTPCSPDMMPVPWPVGVPHPAGIAYPTDANGSPAESHPGGWDDDGRGVTS